MPSKSARICSSVSFMRRYPRVSPSLCHHTPMTDGVPKSAYELAMERLRKKDADAGIVSKPLTDEQKAEIAEIRRTYSARLAQAEILHNSQRRGLQTPDDLES